MIVIFGKGGHWLPKVPYCRRSRKEYIECWRWFISFPIQDQANILNGIRGGWTMRSEIINALFLRKTANSRTIIGKWIGSEEGFLIPRGRESPDKIEGHEL